MNKRAYIFCDASSGCYMEFSKMYVELGCKQRIHDPVLFLWLDTKGQLGGKVMTHMDDLLNGSEMWSLKIM